MKRRIYQVVFLILLNLPLLGPWKWGCVPVLNCHSCPWAVFACPIGVLGHFAQWGIFPFLALGTVALFGAVFGRILCGWVCPFGMLQDLLHRIPSPKWTVPRWMTWIKYVLLLGGVILVPIVWSVDSYAFFCKLCPAGTLESLLPRALAEGNFAALAASWVRLAVLCGTLALAMVSLRSFCKVFCPIGAILAICNRFSAFSLGYAQEDCPECKLCLQECPMDVRIEDFRQDGADGEVITAPAECILCLNCTHNCQQAGLRFSFWNLLSKHKKEPMAAYGTHQSDKDETSDETNA